MTPMPNGSSTCMPSDSSGTISVLQALAEALTTSNDMVGRRLVSCSDFDSWLIPNAVERTCNEIVRAVKATWSAAQNAVNAVAAKLKETFDDLKDWVSSAFSTLGDFIGCAALLRPKERAAVGALYASHASRKRSGILVQRANMEPLAGISPMTYWSWSAMFGTLP